MPGTVLFRDGYTVYRIERSGGEVERRVLALSPDEAAQLITELDPERIPPLLRNWALAGDGPTWLDAGMAAAISPDGPRRVGTVADVRWARNRIPPALAEREREFLLAVARRKLAQHLASPDQTLIVLAREEERLERALGRETAAADSWVSGTGVATEGYAQEWTRFRESFRRHHDQLLRRLEQHSKSVVPNLSAVVGTRVAARLVTHAGSPESLARLPAARLQLLGSRRRPDPHHGPRFGLIYAASRMNEVPPDRQGAYARSLSALAVIAVRADAFTRRDLSAELTRRRDRRVEQLRRRRR